ncbi:hypothetical protein OEA41_004435 [Lepraria neglecta]|uniref:Zn(2)-C6 fungal-type domain-containing protein n=1 Tax=Lepraria neglecta TaxID=209136 RepID=A0AAD9YXV6_9LECA|nr:hypothetical protein OEA41_004435 [Lepraria neglecta]
MPQAHRQQLGLACEECRRRKARCDRVRPSCGSCQDAGAACCYVDKRPQRGPRKGQMDALKNLVANLEQRLGEQMGQQQPNHEAIPSDAFQKPNAVPEAIVPLEHNTALAEIVPMTLSINLENNNLIAAAVSAQYRPLSGMLCAESRRVLEQVDANGAGDYSDTPIEQIQAWLLLAHCELLCQHEHQAMLTAGRAIRMVQLARLHDVDAYNVSFMSLGAETPLFPPSPLSDDESFAEAEEKRRTFWLAYCFDRFCLMRSECPPSLQEESIRTRLPAPEANFQNNQPIRMDFLPEALAHSGRTVLPPFAECVVLNSLFSRCMSHHRLALAAPVSGGNDLRKFWSKHAWLALPVEKRKQLLVQSLPGATDYVDDPMLTFVHALAACAAIYVYQSMAHFIAWPTVDQEVAAPSYEEQAVQAASELVHFVKTMPRSISHFKAHPFLPTLIHRAAVFLMGLPRSPNPIKTGYNNRDDDLNTLLGALRNLQQINNLSRGSLCKLEKDAFCIT